MDPNYLPKPKSAREIRKSRFSYIWCRIFGHWFTIWIPGRNAVCKRCLKFAKF